jgi:hypothetical protein
LEGGELTGVDIRPPFRQIESVDEDGSEGEDKCIEDGI